MADMAEDLTRRLLADAGIGPGMRVLDVGCGRGDVSFIAAGLVGPHGAVLGIDRDLAPTQAAGRRAAELGLANVTFEQADLDTVALSSAAFDAVVGRRVLMYQADAVASLRHLARLLVPRGLVVLQEHDSTAMPVCSPDMPLHRTVHGWMWETVRREGADTRMGLHLAPALERAGFSVERIRAEATVLTADQPHTIGMIARAMGPRMVATGVASMEEIDIETLEARLDAERRQAGGTCIWEMIFGAWARKTG